MLIKQFSYKILLPAKRDVLRVHLYTKLIEYGIQPFENDMDILLELYCFGGYANSEKQEEFFKTCLDKKYKKTKQSLRNTLSKYINLGVLEKPKNTRLHVSSKYIPTEQFDWLLLQPTITHAN